VPPDLAVTLPYWLDRPAAEALEIARHAESAGVTELWLGEMATFEAFTLAGAVAATRPGLRLVVGPLPVTLRDPTMLAMGVASVAEVGGRAADLALGASSPAVTAGWHAVADRPTLQRFRETVTTLRTLLDGGRGPGGFRLRVGRGGCRLVLAAFGPRMLRLGGEVADVVVLNLVTTDQIRAARAVVAEGAASAGRPVPRVAVWVPVAVDEAGAAQVARGLAVYLAQPGYGEMFAAAGFADVVAEARSGRHPRDLAPPPELVQLVGAVGEPAQVRSRILAFGEAGADVVCLAPATAADPGAERLLHQVVGAQAWR
jgi:probable F420-dependent oxidoreductase